jgi:hypothetical protein
MKCPYHVGTNYDGDEICRLRATPVPSWDVKMCLSTENNDWVFVESVGDVVQEAWKYCPEYVVAKSGMHSFQL